MKQLGVGIVGCGVISTIYMENLARRFASVRLVACADILRGRRESRPRSLAFARARIDALLRDPEVDVGGQPDRRPTRISRSAMRR